MLGDDLRVESVRRAEDGAEDTAASQTAALVDWPGYEAGDERAFAFCGWRGAGGQQRRTDRPGAGSSKGATATDAGLKQTGR